MRVVENGADCTADRTAPDCGVRLARTSWHMREALGRTGASDMGIRKTLAREARVGDKGRMV